MNEIELLPHSRVRDVFGLAESAARELGIRDVEVIVAAESSALTRFANNAIHQNVAQQVLSVSVRTVRDNRTARATTNRLDAGSIRRAVAQAAAIMNSVKPLPYLPRMAGPSPFEEVDRFCTATAAASPADRARAIAEAIGIAEQASQTAAGIFSTEQGAHAILNSAGVFAYHAATMARFSVTAMTGDSSGWAKVSAVDRREIDTAGFAARAVEKARLSRNVQKLPPGRYTVVLEPAAVLDLVGQMFGDFSATALLDQRSFLTGRMGQRLFGENISIRDDAYHPLQAGPGFDGEGSPRQRLLLVDAGTPKEVARSRMAAQRDGAPPTGHGFPLPNETGEAPVNIVITGGDVPVDRMVASLDRGILVTRLWYIREVDPYEKIMTGMTRDGTFLVEGGRIRCGVRNFRFNQSLIEMLQNVEALSPSARVSGEETFDMVVPAMQVTDFQFTEVTHF
ncbi:MAG: TldD/PmbA family protein [Bryobacterales bacterium]|nr:TldD/PmbA family protein [Bryobacterales bacterium]